MHSYATNPDQKTSPFNFLFESIFSAASLHSFKELVGTSQPILLQICHSSCENHPEDVQNGNIVYSVDTKQTMLNP